MIQDQLICVLKKKILKTPQQQQQKKPTHQTPKNKEKLKRKQHECVDRQICAISFIFPGRSFCAACLMFFPTRCFASLGRVQGTYINCRKMGWLQVHAFAVSWITVLSLLSFLLCFYFFFFRNVPKTLKKSNKIHSFMLLSNIWTRKAREHRVKFDVEPCVGCRTAITIPWTFLWVPCAPSVLQVKTKAVPLLNDCSFRGWLRTEKTNYLQFKCLFVCKLPHSLIYTYTCMM